MSACLTTEDRRPLSAAAAPPTDQLRLSLLPRSFPFGFEFASQFFPGTSVVETLLWLGDGSMRSPVHFDAHDNLLLQLRGEKHVVLLPPSVNPKLRYARRTARRYVEGKWPARRMP